MEVPFDELRLSILDESIPVGNFQCHAEEESKPLEKFFRIHALDNKHKKLSITWVAALENEPIGFFSLATATIDIEDLDGCEITGCPHYPQFPALLIGKFAVDDRYRRQHVGTWLMDRISAIAIKISEVVGCRYLIVESKPSSAWFYRDTCNFRKARIEETGNILFYKNILTLSEDEPRS